MTGKEELAEKIRQRLIAHENNKADRQSLINAEMEQMIKAREKFSTEARRLLQSIVLPGMKTLLAQFSHGRLLPGDDTAERCKCEFPHTPRFPATVSLVIGFLPAHHDESLRIYAETEILPMHIDYEKHAEENFPADGQSDHQIAQWVDAKILNFVDKYLQLEVHPSYQRENLVRDPVCGMEISTVEAIGSVEKDRLTFHFCSESCRQAFLKGNT